MRLAAALAATLLPLSAGAADLPEVRERGTLRILVVSGDDDDVLPRRGWSPDEDRGLAESFARALGLEVDNVYVEEEEGLIPALLAGRGDMVGDGLEITAERRSQVAFSAPFLYVRDQVVTRADDGELRWRRQLASRRVAANPGMGHWGAVERLKRVYPAMDVEEVHAPTGSDELLEGVAAGRFDVTVASRDLAQEYVAHRDDLRVAFSLGEEVPVAWALPRDAPALRRAADVFLAQAGTWADGDALFTGDLDAIRERGVLRVLTRNAATTYYTWRGRLVGYEFEMFEAFARHLGVHLEIVVPPRMRELGGWLLEGRGDLIAAGLPGSHELLGRDDLAFSTPYRSVRAEIVGADDAPPLSGPGELAGRKIRVAADSLHARYVEQLRAAGVAVEIETAPEDHEAEELIDDVAARAGADVASGRGELTVVGSDLLATQLAWRSDVRSVLTLEPPIELAWALRPGNPELLAAVNAFLTDPKGTSDRATIARRYFERPAGRASGRARVAHEGRISPYDDALRRWAAHYRFDWRLLAAQMYQESGFDPNARSGVGAYGLMQLMPATADEMNVENWTEPEGNVRAGAKYMAWVRDRFQGRLRAEDRNWLALAAYNAGIGHVSDARALARERGLDPDRWFDHVERAMLWKRDPEIYRSTRFGYCRCGEPVEYVRRIRRLYRGYVQSVPLD